MTETPILDDEAVDHLISTAEKFLAKVNSSESERVLINALCATVRHLRAENELWSMWHVKEPGSCGHHPCQLYDLRKITNNPDAAHGCVACEVTALQSQLEQLQATLAQVEQERNELSTEMETCHALLDQFYSEDPAMSSGDTLEQRLKLHLDELRPVITDSDVSGDD